MKKKELIYKLSITLSCSVMGMFTGAATTYLISVYLFNQDLNDAIFIIVAIGLIGSQIGIGLGLKLANRLHKRKANLL